MQVERLVSLLRMSKRTVVYTEAKHTGATPSKGVPPFSYHGVSALVKHGLVNYWIQNGQDRLPLRAQFPEDMLVEVNDDMFGANPNKKVTDAVRKEALLADLVIILDLSMLGITTDIIATAAERSTIGGEGASLGIVIISIKPTIYDCIATLRINSLADDVFQKVLENLEILDEVQADVISVRLDLEEKRKSRKDLVKNVHITYNESDPRSLHGKFFIDTSLSPPKAVDNYLIDDKCVIDIKIQALAELLHKSKSTVIYTEVILNDEMKHDLTYLSENCIPTSYQAICKLAHQGFVHAWIQTGHNGLAQRAGFPGKVFEVYDSWHDVENISYKKVIDEVDTVIEQSDLILILGPSSLLKTQTAQHICKGANHDYLDLGKALGIVMISSQQTYLNEYLSIKINGDPDNILPSILPLMGIQDVVANFHSEVELPVVSLEKTRCNSGEMSKKSCDLKSHRDSITDKLHRNQSIESNSTRLRHGRIFIENELPESLYSEDGKDCSDLISIKAQTILTLLQLSYDSILYLDSIDCQLENQFVSDSCIFNMLSEEAEIKLNFLKGLRNKKLVHTIIQVGHDGITQKAGFSEAQTVEIYPDWENNELFKGEKLALEKLMKNADFILFLSDKLVIPIFGEEILKMTQRSQNGLRFEDGGSLGFGFVGVTTCDHDKVCTVRVNATATEFMASLLYTLDEDTGLDLERKCTASEHRQFFRHLMSNNSNVEVSSHGLAYQNLRCKTDNKDDSQLNIEVDKMNIFINLLKSSRRTVVYTSATEATDVFTGGLFGAKCGIADPANIPTRLHFLLTTLHHQGFIQTWIQHGHNGLPQRSGFPTERTLEVYNSWFNQPTDPFSVELKQVGIEADITDLLLIFGDVPPGPLTNMLLSMPIECCSNGRKFEHGGRLGTVIFNSQMTGFSEQSVLNFYSNPEDILLNVIQSLNIAVVAEVPRILPCPHKLEALVPYTKSGRRSEHDKILLSLKVGERVKLSLDHDHNQFPGYTFLHPLSTKEKAKFLRSGPKFGAVVRFCPEKCSHEVRLVGVSVLVGAWWLDAAIRGIPQTIPFVNCDTHYSHPVCSIESTKQPK